MKNVIDIQSSEPNWGELDPKSTLGDSLRRRLADMILAGDLPINHRLDEQEIADRFNVSRTPVREAIRQLASAGLVEIRPRRGAVVVPVDEEKVGQAFEAAAELESLLAGWASIRGSLIEKGELKKLHDDYVTNANPEDAEAFATMNRQFHDKIAKLAKNEALLMATRLVRVQTAPFQRAQYKSAEECRLSIEDHGKILKAICRQDSEGAKSAMKNHILRASLVALRANRLTGCTDTGG